MHSLARNHALVDGNKRLAFASLFALLGVNGERIVADDDVAYEFVVDIASGVLDEVAAIAAWIDDHTAPAAFGG